MIADDGGVLLRGPRVMRGYWNLPDANAETLLADDWMATGDIGRLDEKSRLKITDRKGPGEDLPGGRSTSRSDRRAVQGDLVVASTWSCRPAVNFASALISWTLRPWRTSRRATGGPVR